MASIEELERICSQCRRDIVRMTHDAKSGHPGGSLGCTEYMVALYFHVLEHDPSAFDMNGVGEDLFFLSNGHISPIWYSVLARNGYFPTEELSSFRKLDSRLQGHPATAEGLPGIRVASGSLGQGLSVALGASISKRLNGNERIVYSLHGDGELQEGQIWEAAMYAGSKGIDGLIATIDYNGRQIDGDVADINDLGDLRAKWEAFGWEVLEMNGNIMREVVATLEHARTRCRKGHPIMIIMHTEMGQGVDFMMGSHEWHGVPPNDEQLEDALGQLEETLGDY